MEIEVVEQHFKTIDSTNRYAKEHLSELDLSQLHLFSADEQTAGRGTHGKQWLSPEGGVYMTFVVPFCQVPYQIGLVLAVSCLQVFEAREIVGEIRWPNDLLIDQKKVAGILSEEHGDALIVGIGINVGIDQKLLDSLDQPATSLPDWPPEQLRAKIVEQLQTNLARYTLSGFDAIYPDYCKRIAYLGHRVRVTLGKRSHEGVLKRVLPDGLLQLEIAPEEVMTIVSGQIRPI